MLWSFIGLLTAFVLGLAFVQSFHGKAFQRVRWIGALMFAWALNTAFGLAVFLMTSMGIITNYWIWKPCLMASSFGFMGIAATILYVTRHVEPNGAVSTVNQTWTSSILGLGGLATGTAIQILIVLGVF